MLDHNDKHRLALHEPVFGKIVHKVCAMIFFPMLQKENLCIESNFSGNFFVHILIYKIIVSSILLQDMDSNRPQGGGPGVGGVGQGLAQQDLGMQGLGGPGIGPPLG